MIESRSSNLKALEKNPGDGFRLPVCKDNTKRQGSSVSSCILSLIGFLREILVGRSQSSSKSGGSQSQLQKDSGFNDAASQKSSVAGRSDMNASAVESLVDASLKQHQMR